MIEGNLSVGSKEEAIMIIQGLMDSFDIDPQELEDY